MLHINSLQSAYGTSQVLFDVNLTIKAGEVVTLMGRNGMGKTTTIKTIMGLLPVRGGSVVFNGQSLNALAPEQIARLGIGLVPEGRQVFPTLSVRENLIATAADRFQRAHPWTLPRVFALFPRLGERRDQMAATLSGGEQQMLAIGRALMTNPHLLILDEATEGLAPLIRAEIWACLKLLKQEGQSILVIDKALSALQHLTDRHFILEKGVSVWTGTSEDVARDKEKVNAWIGL
jgi:branched-chain amino acid transport system ATP-binding protein